MAKKGQKHHVAGPLGELRFFVTPQAFDIRNVAF